MLSLFSFLVCLVLWTILKSNTIQVIMYCRIPHFFTNHTHPYGLWREPWIMVYFQTIKITKLTTNAYLLCSHKKINREINWIWCYYICKKNQIYWFIFKFEYISRSKVNQIFFMIYISLRKLTQRKLMHQSWC